ncbi:MAG: cupin domain-containing protein [Kiloniellales bacterium]|nr:cupin domain-containing protein [Kiloniellales bacterium]
MPDPKPQALDLRDRYLHLREGGAAVAVEGGAEFWRRLLAGESRYEGRLVTAFDLTEDMAHWEMHSAGEELLFCHSGRFEVLLEQAEGRSAVSLGAGQALVVPRGAWHRLRVREPGRMIFVTWGDGTRHRPL